MQVTTNDIKKRVSSLSRRSSYNEGTRITGIYNNTKESFNTDDIETVVKEWQTLNRDTNLAIVQVLELLEGVSENCSIGFTNKITSMICEDSVPKVRDAAQTQAYLKQKLGRFKTKLSTKINNNVDDMKNAVNKSLANLKHNTGQIKSNVTSAMPGKKKDENLKECYERIYDELEKYRVCDRVLENHNKLSKRFNIDKLITEYSAIDNYTAIVEMCRVIDTYNIPFKAKYSIAIENSLYAMDKNRIPYDRKEIVNAATDYFLFNNEESNPVKDMKDLVSLNMFFSDLVNDDNCKISNTHADIQFDYFFNQDERNQSTQIFSNRKEAEMELMSEMYGISDNASLINEAFKKNKKKKGPNKLAKAVADFKKGVKTPEALKKLTAKLYTTPAEDIIDEAPHILGMIRLFFVLMGSMAIAPIITPVAVIADQVIKMNVQRKETEKMIKTYEKELEKANKALDKAKSAKDKERCEAYVKSLERALDKLNSYNDNLYTDAENDARDAEKYGSDDDDFELEAAVHYLAMAESDIDTINTGTSYETLSNIKAHIDQFDFDNIDALSEFIADTEYIVDGDGMIGAFEESVKELRAKPNKSAEDYMRLDCLKENIYKIYNAKREPFKSDDPYVSLARFHEEAEFFRTLLEVVELLDTEVTPLDEASITNSLKMAGIKLKKMAVGFKDKEKSMSDSIDASMSNLQKGIEKAATVDSREAVIKGSIIPPASKIIKMAITSGVAWVINPALAVITVLGGLAVSKKYQAKERQLILDEIEIELQMCEKYLKIAEDNNDMKATKQLLTTQRALQRQQQRIKYKMKVDFNQDAPSVKPEDYDD